MRTIWRVLGLLTMLAGIACFLLAGPLHVHALEFGEKYLSLDHNIRPLLVEAMQPGLILHGVLALCVGGVIALRPNVLPTAVTRLRGFLSHSSDKQFSIALFWSSSIAGLILVGLWLLRELPAIRFLHAEDLLLEMLTAILFIASSVFFFRAAMFHQRQRVGHHKIVATLLIGIAVVFLFFGLEEISWGQRLFGWSTPAVLERINDQGELNIHNINNSFLASLYRWGMAAFALVTVAGWLWISRFKKTPLRFLMPHWATAGLLVLMLLFGTFWLQNEIVEELGAVFALLYALTTIRASRPRHLTT